MIKQHLFRFYVSPDNVSASQLVLVGDEHHHLKKVLRLNIREEVDFFNGKGLSGLATIDSIQSNQTILSVVSQKQSIKTNYKKRLILGALDFKSLDDVLPAIIELGVDELLIFRSEQQNKSRLQPKLLERWQKIAIGACKQAKRDFLLNILCFDNLKDCLSSSENNCQKILFDKSSAQSVWSFSFNKDNSLNILIGSESGLSISENALAISEFGYLPVRLSSQTLRSTTALVSAATVFDYFYSR